MKNTLYIIIALISLLSCNNKSKKDIIAPPHLIKFKGNYTKNVIVLLNQNKTNIVGFPSKNDCMGSSSCFIQDVHNGYVYDAYCCLAGLNSGVLDIKRDKYNDDTVTKDILMTHLLDKDPFVEFWEMKVEFVFDSMKGNTDTTFINKIIDDGKIETYFNRIK